ncbi:MAG TPA: 3-ketoacyl-ACP reductase [Acidobacteriaceae bacterium]|nr:3-ketoacyl-ACP reductase [Acidobacteriaceae bacterium]
MRDRVALITGGTRGIGLGIARKLAEAGLTVVVTGRRPADQVQPVLEQLKKESPRSIYMAADVASAADRQQLLKTIEQQLGRLDVLVNNAGIAPRVRADVLEAGEESFDEIIATNLRGPYFLTQAVANWMIRNPAPNRSIINISSVSATVASVNRGDYCISKAGIAMATKLWAARLAEYGIGVYEVRPGIIETDMTGGVKAKYDALIAGGILLEKRWGTPEDIGTAVSTLARGDIPYATGAVLILDGGLTLARL